MKISNWLTRALDRVWFGDSWVPWIRVVVPILLVLATLAIVTICIERTLLPMLLVAGLVALASR